MSEAWIETAALQIARSLEPWTSRGGLRCSADGAAGVIAGVIREHMATCPPAEPMAEAVARLVLAAHEARAALSVYAARIAATGCEAWIDVPGINGRLDAALARLESPPGLSAPTGAGTAAS